MIHIGDLVLVGRDGHLGYVIGMVAGGYMVELAHGQWMRSAEVCKLEDSALDHEIVPF